MSKNSTTKAVWKIHSERTVHMMILAGMFTAAMLVASSCGSVQPVRVLPAGQTELTASLGGPILPKSSPTIIVPYFMVGAMHGVSESLTLTGNVHALMAAFGVLGLDGGVAMRLVRQQGALPEITAKAQAYFFSNFRPNATRVFPYLSVNTSYQVADGWLGYGGVEALYQFTGSPNVFLTPFVGVQSQVSDKITLQLDGKWMAANVFTGNGIFEAQSSIGNTGSVAVHLGFSYLLDLPKPSR